MALFDRENDMVTVVCHHLVANGYQVFREVAYYGRRMDVLALRNNQFWAYEAKLTQWSRALGQARWHVTAVDFSSVVLPLPLAERVDLLPFRRHGLGVIGITHQQWVTLVPPVTSALMWEPAKAQLFRTVQAFRDAGTSLASTPGRVDPGPSVKS